MAAIAQNDEEAKARLKAFLEKRAAKVEAEVVTMQARVTNCRRAGNRMGGGCRGTGSMNAVARHHTELWRELTRATARTSGCVPASLPALRRPPGG